MRNVLPRHILGQDIAIEYITEAIGVWEANRRSQLTLESIVLSEDMDNDTSDTNNAPLVLAFTGRTGVGRTNSIAQTSYSAMCDYSFPLVCFEHPLVVFC